MGLGVQLPRRARCSGGVSMSGRDLNMESGMRNLAGLVGAARPSKPDSPAFQWAAYRWSGRSRAARCILCCAVLCAWPARAQEPSQTDLNKMSIEDLAKMKVDSVYGASKTAT